MTWIGVPNTLSDALRFLGDGAVKPKGIRPRMLVSVTDEEYASRERTHAGRDLSWGPFDPQPRGVP